MMSPDVVIALRVAELRELAALTALAFARGDPRPVAAPAARPLAPVPRFEPQLKGDAVQLPPTKTPPPGFEKQSRSLSKGRGG